MHATPSVSATIGPRTRQRGLGLLEILVAVLVMAVGLLGLAGMHLYGMRHTQSSNTLSTATGLAQEMAERMRANLRGVNDNHYMAVNVTNDSDSCSGLVAPSATRGCYGTTCSAGELATADIQDWHRKICLLTPPGTVASVTCVDSDTGDGDPCTDGSRHDIRFVWSDLDVQVVDGTRKSVTASNQILLVFNPLNPSQ